MLSQPATKVTSPMTAGAPFTGPSVLTSHTFLPSASRQYRVESCEPMRTFVAVEVAPGLISPSVSNSQTGFPSAALTAVELAVEVADVDAVAPHARRRLHRAELDLPLFLAGGEVEGVEVLVERRDVNHAADDGRGALDGVRRS